jgi:hypothetical protein
MSDDSRGRVGHYSSGRLRNFREDAPLTARCAGEDPKSADGRCPTVVSPRFGRSL